MFDRFFRLRENGTSVRTECLAGLTTFLTMAYIVFVQPAVLSQAGMDRGAVMAATCVASALATAIMGLYARYPIAQAPGMGENFFFTLTVVPAAATLIAAQIEAGSLAPGDTEPWKIALGVVFVSGVLFLFLTLAGLRQALLDAISPSLRNAIAVGIGLFIAFLGLQAATLIRMTGSHIGLNPRLGSPDLVVFFFGLMVTAGLFARGVRGSIFWGILGATLFAWGLQAALAAGVLALPGAAESGLMTLFKPAAALVAPVPSMAPTFLQMDLVRAVSWPMLPMVLVFLFMVVFDTLGTLVGVAERAGFIRDNQLPRANQAFLSDAAATVVGAACGTSTVTSFIESIAGVEQGGRTGLTSLVVAALFLLALFFSPVVEMVGSYPPITAPALVVVGSLMMHGVLKVQWANFAEAMPAFLVIVGIPLSYSIADGLALGLIGYPIIKLLAGQRRDVKWTMYLLALVLLAYFVFVRG